MQEFSHACCCIMATHFVCCQTSAACQPPHTLCSIVSEIDIHCLLFMDGFLDYSSGDEYILDMEESEDDYNSVSDDELDSDE